MKWTNKKLKGLTLVELLVVISILSIVMPGMSMLVYTAWTSQAYQIKLGQAAFLASRGVTTVVKNIRQAQQADNGAYLLQSGDDFDIVFYANVDDDDLVERVHYYLQNGNLLMGVTEPSTTPPYSYPSGDEETRTISGNVVNTGAEYIFRYYDTNAALLTTPVVTGSVRMVEVRLLVDVDPYSSPIPIPVKSTTTMRNLVNY